MKVKPTRFWWIVVTTFGLRLGLSTLPSFQVDMDAWMAWAMRLAELSPKGFYSDTVWTQYTPGFLYWLWGMGKLGWVSPWAVKIPVIMADLWAGWLVTRIVKAKSRLSWWLYVGYVLSPVVIWDGSVWGQIDGILALAMLIAVYYLVERRNWWASWVAMGVALLIKPQAIALLPVLTVVTIVRLGWARWLMGVSLTGLVLLAGFMPFFPDDAWRGMVELSQKMSASYPYTSLFANNVWALVGTWQPDTAAWIDKTYLQWGVIMAGIAMGVTTLSVWRKLKKDKGATYWLASVACWIFFLFPTRVHERYLFPMFVFAYVYAGLVKRKAFYWLLGITTGVYMLNLYVPYAYYEPATNWLKNEWLMESLVRGEKLLAGLMVLIFTCWSLFPWITAHKLKSNEAV